MAAKVSRRQQKKAAQRQKQDQLNARYVADLERAFRGPVRWTCEHCLLAAYQKVTTGAGGYVSDDDLIDCSRGLLRR